jgi:hypothetical protein
MEEMEGYTLPGDIQQYETDILFACYGKGFLNVLRVVDDISGQFSLQRSAKSGLPYSSTPGLSSE